MDILRKAYLLIFAKVIPICLRGFMMFRWQETAAWTPQGVTPVFGARTATPVVKNCSCASCCSLITHLMESPRQKRCVSTYVSFPRQSVTHSAGLASHPLQWIICIWHTSGLSHGDSEVVIWRERAYRRRKKICLQTRCETNSALT